MSSPQVQLQKQAQNIAAGVEAVRDAGLPTPRSDEVAPEPMVSDQQRIAAGIGDVGENLARLSRALGHMDTHITSSQDKEIERLRERVEQLEKGSSKGAAKK